MQQTPKPLAHVPEAVPPLVVHSELKKVCKFNIKYKVLDVSQYILCSKYLIYIFDVPND
jgi:hypothetical protein